MPLKLSNLITKRDDDTDVVYTIIESSVEYIIESTQVYRCIRNLMSSWTWQCKYIATMIHQVKLTLLMALTLSDF